MTIWSFVDQLGPIRAFAAATTPWRSSRPVGPMRPARPTPLRCPDPEAEEPCVAEIDAAIEAGDSIGGSFVVVAEGMPIGVGSNAEWDTRLDARSRPRSWASRPSRAWRSASASAW